MLSVVVCEDLLMEIRTANVRPKVCSYAPSGP